MTFHAMKLKRSFAPYVTQSKMSNNIASIAESVWESTSVLNANSSTMTFSKANTTVMNVAYVELAVRRTSFIAANVLLFGIAATGCCYSKLMREVHRCVERAMHHNCPVCFEYLFDTMKDVTVLPCGHTMHLACIPVLSAQSLSVICQNCGENSTKRLTQPQCLQHTKIRWYGFYATIVESIQMYSSILWHINARIASRTTRDRHAEAPLLLLRARQECLRW
ncbi:hypothetical protein V6N13_094306 [Hibiscus sabdariffa]